jgi:hypothetical protein
MQLNVKFNSKFLVDYALCGTAQSRLRAMRHSAELRLFAMQHSAELQLTNSRYLSKIETKFENILG